IGRSAPIDVDDLDRTRQAPQRRGPEIRGPMRLADRPDAGDDIAGAAEGRDARRLVDALAVEVAAHPCRIGGVEADSDMGSEALRRAVLGETPLDGDRGGDGKVRRVEADEESVTGRGDLLAIVGREDLSEGGVVPAEDGLPGL